MICPYGTGAWATADHGLGEALSQALWPLLPVATADCLPDEGRRATCGLSICARLCAVQPVSHRELG